jgi:exodeoxyribonuclease VII large subunit
LIRALKQANEFDLGDVILLTRGGGSLEDLWCFNHELLAREIFSSRIPVVSAVGHEVDFTIADFVADLRAATPSAAAEILVREKQALVESVEELQQRLVKNMRTEIGQARLRLQALGSKLKSPRDRITDLRLRFDDWGERLQSAMSRSLERRKQKLQRLEDSLQALSPLQVLGRGYALVYQSNGTLLKSATQAKSGDKVSVRLSDGNIDTRVV